MFVECDAKVAGRVRSVKRRTVVYFSKLLFESNENSVLEMFS